MRTQRFEAWVMEKNGNRESEGVGFWKEVCVEKHVHSQVNEHGTTDLSSKRVS